jgi:RND family efflux transporter MFP subunit
MTRILSIVLLLTLASCGATSTDTKEAKEKQLTEYRKQISEIKEKISVLEEELNIEKEIEITNVSVEEVSVREFSHMVEVTGNVEAEEDVNVSPETQGNIISIDVTEGQWVKKGTVLGRLNTEAIEHNIGDLKIQYELVEIIYKKQKNLWDQNIGSEIEYLQAKSNKESMQRKIEAMRAQLKFAIITSPVSGVVDRIYQDMGEMAGPQMPFAKVVNISKVRVYADVSERYLNSFKAGDEVEIEFPAIGKTVQAKIYRKSNIINPDNRTFRLRINLNNEDNAIMPNLISIIHLKDFYNPEAIVVPSILIKNDFNGKYLYVAKSNNNKWNAEKYYVETGISDNNNTTLKNGLKPGDLLITKGFDQIANGSEIEFKNKD